MDKDVKKLDHDKKMKVSKAKSKPWEKDTASKASDDNTSGKKSSKNKPNVVEEPKKVNLKSQNL